MIAVEPGYVRAARVELARRLPDAVLERTPDLEVVKEDEEFGFDVKVLEEAHPDERWRVVRGGKVLAFGAQPEVAVQRAIFAWGRR